MVCSRDSGIKNSGSTSGSEGNVNLNPSDAVNYVYIILFFIIQFLSDILDSEISPLLYYIQLLKILRYCNFSNLIF